MHAALYTQFMFYLCVTHMEFKSRRQLLCFIAVLRFIVGALFLLASRPSSAAHTELGAQRWPAMTPPLFKTYSTPAEVGGAGVKVLAQDRDGFIWAGTERGVARWDGYRFQIFQPSSGDGVAQPDNYVVKLFFDDADRLWVGTVTGNLARFDRAHDRFVVFSRASGDLLPGRITGIVSDGAGGLWVGSLGGLVHVPRDAVPGSGAVTRYRESSISSNGDISSIKVTSLQREASGTLWMGTARGLMRKDAGSPRFEDVPLPPSNGAPPNISAVFVASDGKIWIGTRDNLMHVLDPSTKTIRSITVTAFPRSINEPHPGEIWFNTFANGIIVVNASTLKWDALKYDPLRANGLPSNMVDGFLRDRSGAFWLATQRGITRFEPGLAATSLDFNGLKPGLVMKDGYSTVFAHPNGTVWMGATNGGVDIVNPTTGSIMRLETSPNQLERRLPEAAVLDIAVDAIGEVGICTNRGLYRATADGQTVTRVHLPTLNSTGGMSRFARAGSKLLMGTFDNGLYMVSGTLAKPEKVEAIKELSGMQISALEQGPNGTFWVGTSTGLYLVDPTNGTVVEQIRSGPDEQHLLNDRVHALATDRQGRLWISTLAGLQILEGRTAERLPRLRRMGRAEGLPDAQFGDLKVDAVGMIWGVSSDGLIRINPDNLAIERLRRSEGVALPDYWASSTLTAAGEFVVGGEGGATIVWPGRFEARPCRPSVVATAIRVGGKLLPMQHAADRKRLPLTITPEANSVEIEFAALDYHVPELNRYAYRLVGFDKDWVETDSGRRVASYTNLSPGRYTLQVRGSDHNGNWVETPLQIDVDVLPAWNQTWWAQFLFAVVFLGGVYALYRWRIRQLAAQRAALERVVEERTAEVAARTAEVLQQKEEAQAARDKAEEATQAKSRFLANMSHEIRTPMNAVLGLSYLALATNLSSRQRDYVQKIHLAGKTLLGVINDILDFSKIEAGKLDIESTDFDLDEALEQVSSLTAPFAAEKGLEYRFELADDVPCHLRGDPLRLGQVLINLLNNAIKFTAEGAVTLTVRAMPAAAERVRLEFSVRDTGIGMTAEQLERLFKPFSQADGSTTRQFGGTGLGLSISRDLVTLMGGAIDVESETGVGSRFHFALEFDRAHQPVSLDASVRRTIMSTPHFRDARVLLVEDNDINRQIVTELLQGCGIEVDAAVNGRVALDRLRLVGPAYYDLVFMDLQMPEMDGSSATRHVRNDRAFDDLPVIALSANAMQEDRLRCLQEGFDDHLGKPLQPAELYRLLREYLKDKLSDDVPASEGAQVDEGAEEGAELPAELAGIDLTVARTVAGNNDGLLAELLRRFAQEEDGTARRIAAAFQQQDYASAELMAHTLRGVAGNLGARQVQELAGAAEAAAQSHVEWAQVQRDVEALAEEMARVCQGIAAALPEQVLEEAPALSAPLAWQEALQELAQLLAAMDGEANARFAALRGEFQARYGTKRTADLQRCLDMFDFDGAHDILTATLEK
ncbi:ATP-binding protein [Pseudoduganella sp. R-34]|uniref:hybrid sensor histidine kinase/response regulator n=1 Tax=Pseudoduganella sp. R-34 TaxID=3404062 RepID=UPI003CFB3AF8